MQMRASVPLRSRTTTCRPRISSTQGEYPSLALLLPLHLRLRLFEGVQSKTPGYYGVGTQESSLTGKEVGRRVQMHVCIRKQTIHHQGMTAASIKTTCAALCILLCSVKTSGRQM